MVTPAYATKPAEDVNPNGFPNGEHYNLNIIGKKDRFTCPEQEYDEFGDPIYGNVVFVPQNGEGIEIFMLVTDNGFETPYVSLTRKKWKSVAVDITGLFEWTGDVSYFTEDCCDPVLGCDATVEVCCTDADMDGIYESCVLPLLGNARANPEGLAQN